MKIDRRKPNRAVDPEYPFYCRVDEAGEIVYSVPLEAPNDIPEDEGEGAWHPEYSWLPLFGGKKQRVYFHETTDREWAFRVRRMLNTAYMRDFRHTLQEIPLTDCFGEAGYEQECPDTTQQLLDRMEIEAIRERVIARDPRWWDAFCQIRLLHRDAKDVAAEKGISVQRVYQLANKVPEIAVKMRREAGMLPRLPEAV